MAQTFDDTYSAMVPWLRYDPKVPLKGPGDRAGLPVRWASPAMRPTPPAPRRRAPPQLGPQMCAYPFPSTQPPPTRPSRSASKGPTTPDPYRLGRGFLLRLAETNPAEAPPGPARSFEAEQPFEVALSTSGVVAAGPYPNVYAILDVFDITAELVTSRRLRCQCIGVVASVYRNGCRADNDG